MIANRNMDATPTARRKAGKNKNHQVKMLPRVPSFNNAVTPVKSENSNTVTSSYSDGEDEKGYYSSGSAKSCSKSKSKQRRSQRHLSTETLTDKNEHLSRDQAVRKGKPPKHSSSIFFYRAKMPNFWHYCLVDHFVHPPKNGCRYNDKWHQDILQNNPFHV